MTATDKAPDTVGTDLVTLTIDGVQVSVPKDTLVIRAAEQVGVQIPRFCDHPLLDPVGACRQCLVDIPDAGNGRGFPKPQASCTLPVAEGMVVNTQATSEVADKAQQGVMEFLLINHPLDCPVCDKGGECPLQNQAMSNGRGESRFAHSGGIKRTFPKPIHISAQVLLDRERCVLCARCTRFSEQIAGDPFIALAERGALQQVAIYEREPYESYFSGNAIQICPVGALTSADYRFRSRPFDLVSNPGVAEHDACGAAIRIDHRRGKVMRRLAGNDPEVNEEWISDKDRFGFRYTQVEDRITYPQVREDGELRPASWPEAFAVAARGLRAAGAAAVLTGGRVTAEDAYAYAKFARVALGTNDVDFRARPHSAEEASFLASHVALTGGVTYADLEAAPVVVLLGLEPEDEAATIFLRLRKAAQRGRTQVVSVAPYTSRGLRKMKGRLVPAVPGTEVEVIGSLRDAEHGVTKDAIILVGERLAGTHGALTAAAELAAGTGARLAWVPRRAGDRGAVEAGALPNLLPGGRPVTEATARVDLAAAWGVDTLPAKVGRDGNAIVAALAKGELGGVVVGGVDPDDTADPAAFRAALDAAGFVVSLELRETDVTRVADVVLPVAPVADKAGTFVTWDARPRAFEAVFANPSSLPDLRVLAGIAQELGRPLGFRTVADVRAEMQSLGPWDGARPAHDAGKPPRAAKGRRGAGALALATWKQLVDLGSMQDGEAHLRATGRTPVVRVSRATYESVFGLLEGGTGREQLATVSGDRGSVTLPVLIADLPDDVVWVPARSFGRGVLADLASPGSPVTLRQTASVESTGLALKGATK
ncbi:NADH-quinone oxidoreductase subunit G [Nocardioides sp. S-58]|uniref:NADH-quinone oxidoreductase n=1 Tax=Nocardioides renjunii TaxID=3095075 RepID=A0ABU5KE06_9ACTN|nr:NADH-quinone oxidoreductase subunit G [Nocardioides sp. S-58]MDZ5663196.1 NADH-quinone oxidoreductase subunit G [Nocardioides sp. S-58]